MIVWMRNLCRCLDTRLKPFQPSNPATGLLLAGLLAKACIHQLLQQLLVSMLKCFGRRFPQRQQWMKHACPEPSLSAMRGSGLRFTMLNARHRWVGEHIQSTSNPVYSHGIIWQVAKLPNASSASVRCAWNPHHPSWVRCVGHSQLPLRPSRPSGPIQARPSTVII